MTWPCFFDTVLADEGKLRELMSIHNLPFWSSVNGVFEMHSLTRVVSDIVREVCDNDWICDIVDVNKDSMLVARKSGEQCNNDATNESHPSRCRIKWSTMVLQHNRIVRTRGLSAWADG